MAQGQQEVTAEPGREPGRQAPSSPTHGYRKIKTYFLFRKKKKIGAPALINLKPRITDRQASEVSVAGSKPSEVR